MCFSIVYSSLFTIEFAAILETGKRTRLIVCSQVCTSDQQVLTVLNSPFVPVFLSFLPLAWIPSLITVVITATWSCVIFKKSYTGGNDQLNRRILSIPFVMPAVVIVTNLFSTILFRTLTNEIFFQLLGCIHPTRVFLHH